MKRPVLILTALMALALLSAAPALGQRVSNYVERLARADSTSARATVIEHGEAAGAIARLQASGSQKAIRGYRIRIFFDNSQNARPAASAALGRFREMFPDIPAYMAYENPYFKVTVGNCITNEEAIILWGRIKPFFDKAFVIREDISIDKLGE